MAKKLYEESNIQAIADAIREKNGETTTYKTSEMAAAIINLPSGGGGGDIPEEAFTITGSCNYRFADNGWNWFVNEYGNRITTVDITNSSYMFQNAHRLTSIPFEINMVNKSNQGASMQSMFNGCTNITDIPDIDCHHNNYADMNSFFYNCGKITKLPYLYNAYPSNISGMFQSCYMVRNIPEDYFDTWNISRLTDYSYANMSNLFCYCYSLRKLPMKFLERLAPSALSSTYNSIYYSLACYCSVLDDAIDLPVLKMTATSNLFSSTFQNTYRLKDLIFKTNEDGTPQTAKWKSQVINLTDGVGYASSSISSAPLENWTESQIKSASYSIISYNSGITRDKAIYSAETYQALKDDPDSYCLANSAVSNLNYGYSRYTHRSAVNTINSLPDTSAYLATAGGTNTIKFKGAAGGLTDEGAINTLTEAEIAVAAAKGWTVSLV